MNSLTHPLHPAQRDVFTDQMVNLYSPHYNIGGYIRIKGPLNAEKLKEAINIVPQVFDAFKIRFKTNLTDRAFVMEKEYDRMEVMDLDLSKNENPEQEGLAWMKNQLNKPFVLGSDELLFEQYLIKISEEEHWAFSRFHHLIIDGFGFIIWTQYVVAKYKALILGDNIEFSYPRYLDEAVKASAYLDSESYKLDADYWREKFSQKPQKFLQRKFHARNNSDKKASTYCLVINEDEKRILDDIQILTKSGLQQLTIAALLVHYGKTSGQTEFVFGTPVHKRGSRQLRNTVGMFAGILPFKGSYNKDSILSEVIKDIAQSQKKDYRHQHYLISDLGRHLKLNSSEASMFDIIVNHEPFNFDLDFGEGIEATVLRMTNDFGTIPLLMLWEDYGSKKPLQLFFHFRDDFFTLREIELLARRILFILMQFQHSLDKSIGSITILPEAEVQLLEQFNHDLSIDYPKDKTIVSLFEEQALKTPDEVAIVFEDQSLSYKTLNERANQLAHYLRSRGVKEDSLVPLCVERSAEMIIGMLGILKAGAAYVPVEPDFPEERKRFILRDTSATMIVSTAQRGDSVPAFDHIEIIKIDDPDSPVNNQPTTNLRTALRSDHLAYVIYTSGSTGKPKGVMIEHRNLTDYVVGLKEHIQIDQCGSYALVSSIATDLGNTVIYSSLVFGGSLHVFSKESVSNIEYIHQYFKTHSIDCLKIVPSHWKALCVKDELLLPSKLLAFGGEALLSEMVEHIRIQAPDLIVVNHYGPTETTIGKLLHVVKENTRYNTTIPIGRPFSNTRVYVLSRNLELCPIGIPGELHIAGDGLARGYLNNSELTDRKFIQDPFDQINDSVMYRTGDMVRWLEDGNIEFIGRTDDQVKIRGYRVELGEIESLLLSSGRVSQVAVLAKEDKAGDKRLVSYVVTNGEFDKEWLLSYLKGRLPEYMVPGVWVEMENFPLLPNGKTDKKSLPDPELTEHISGEFIAPRTETESMLTALWREVLKVDRIGVNDNFFELGGHSLLAVRLISAIRKQFEVEIPISHVFDYPTVALLAVQVNKPSNVKVLPAILPGESRPEHIPLSFSQERLWFIHQLEGSVHYHIPAVLRLHGKLNREALAYSLGKIVDRHEVLRTVYLEDQGQAYQRVNDSNGWALSFVEGGNYQQDPEALKSYLQQIINEPFDLKKDYMLRGHLIALGQEEYLLVIILHHIASDGWSSTIIINEAITLYRSLVEDSKIQLSTLPVQYADYALWQRNYFQGEIFEKKLNYWKTKLENVQPLQLPTDHVRPWVWNNRGASKNFTIDKDIADQLQILSQQQGATLFMVLLAAFKVLLYRYSNQQDICVGTAIAGRQQQEVERLIGIFINTLALRSAINGNTSFENFLQQVKLTTMEAYEHQEVPFEKVVGLVVKERDLSRSPLTQVQFLLQNTPPLPELQLREISFSIEEFEHRVSKFDITFSITETPGGLTGFVEYAASLFNEATISRMIDHFSQLLSSIVKNPKQTIGILSMLTRHEEKQLLYEFNHAEIDQPDRKSIVDLFEEQVARTPEATALYFDEKEVSYKELNEKANQLASLLVKKGAKDGMLIAICMGRSVEMIVGMLGILKSGAAYVPIDPTYPEERIRYMVEDSGVTMIISSKAVMENLPMLLAVDFIELDECNSEMNDQLSDNLQIDIHPDQLAYIIYTSGSTGNPKGVMIEHQNVYSFLQWSRQEFLLSRFDVVYATTSLCFDLSIFEIFYPLTIGKRVRIIGDVSQIEKYLQSDTGVLINSVPSVIQLLLSQGINLSNISVMNMAGEPIPLQLIRSLDAEKIEIRNLYGPTESTTYSTVYRMHRDSPVLIGKPVSNTRIYILNKELGLTPVGITGEIYISGAGLARGYLNRPELTAEKFIVNPFSKDPGARLYRTGDLGRWLADGNLECFGRVDDQVKINGYRVEPGEIESMLQKHELVAQAVVISKDDGDGNRRLVAYIVPNGSFSPETLGSYLKEKLPRFMVPGQWLELQQIPLTPNGKIDKKALPHPGIDTARKYVEPQTELEIKLVQIWQELLKVEKVGIEDNFFELGGHSLLAMRMISIIERDLRLSIPIQVLFKFTTISELSKYVEIQSDRDPHEKNTTAFEMIDI